MKRLSFALAVLTAAALAAGCSSPVKLSDSTDVPVETRTPNPAGGAGTAGSGAAVGQSQVATVNTGPAASTGVARVVYFDYDSFVVKDEFRPLIDGQAKRLAGNRNQRAAIEGHTDERGGREYNLALGQKRAEAVLRSMTLLGATDAQLEAVSFGKERPAVQGSDESAWAKNRRAELKDK